MAAMQYCIPPGLYFGHGYLFLWLYTPQRRPLVSVWILGYLWPDIAMIALTAYLCGAVRLLWSL